MVPTLRHVLVIGVDGVRFDLLGPEVTPVIWDFRCSGFLGPVPVDEATPTWSGPCWATIATGTGVDAHGITSNDLTGHRLAAHWRRTAGRCSPRRAGGSSCRWPRRPLRRGRRPTRR